MFELEKAIESWRRDLLVAGIKTPVPLEELESHLRDEIERQTKSGLIEAEAFRLAVQKIGPAQTVQKEFEKVAVARELKKRREGQIWADAILGLLQLIVVGAVLFNSEMNLSQRISGLAAMAASLVLAVAVGWVSRRIFPVIRAQRKRNAMLVVAGAPGILWTLVFAHYFLTGHEFPFGQWLATLLWTLCPLLGVYLGLIWGIEGAAGNQILAQNQGRHQETPA